MQLKKFLLMLIVYPYAGVKRLFNLLDDPQDMKDLTADPAQYERVEEMFTELQELQVSMGETGTGRVLLKKVRVCRKQINYL